MNKVKFSFLFILFLFISSFQLYSNETLVFSSFENSGMSLVEEAVIREAYRRLNFDIEIRPYPAERALIMSNSGELDGELGRLSIISDLYENLVIIPVPLHNIKVVIFSHVNKLNLTSYDDLNKYELLILNGYKYGEFIYEKYGVTYLTVNTKEQLFELLKIGRYDGAMLTIVDGLHTLNNLGYDDFVYSNVLESIGMYHFLHKKHMDLVPSITKILKDMQDEGYMDMSEELVLKSLQINN